MKNGRALLNLLSDRPVAYHPDIARIVGGVKAAVFLCQLLYWTGKGKRLDGYIWKIQTEWEKEIALTRYEQEGARKKLKELGILKEKLRGIPAKLHYKVDTDRLLEMIGNFYNKPADKDAENPPTKIAENPHTITEITQESTLHGADAPSETEPSPQQEQPQTLLDALEELKENPQPLGVATFMSDTPLPPDDNPLGDLGTEWHKQNDTPPAETPHYSQRMNEPWTRWGAESEEMQRQLNRFGEKGRTVQRIGHELERQFGMRPLWGDKAAVRGWMSGLSTILQEAEGDEKLVIQAARELREAGLDVATPYSLRKKVASLAAKGRSSGKHDGASVPYSDAWYKARMAADPQYQAFAEAAE